MLTRRILQSITLHFMLKNYLFTSANSLGICREYCLNQSKCLDQYFKCLSNYQNQRLRKKPEFFSSSSEQLNGPFCGKQSFESKVASYSNLVPRIVGGVDAQKAEFPWVVSLQKQSRGKFIHFCGGTIIGDYYILTAAHCADVFVGEEDKLRIKLGSNNIDNNNDGIYMKVSQIIVHEQWDRDSNLNDIAIYKTAQPIKYSIEEGSYLVNSICLPNKTDSEPSFAVVVGWGQMSAQSQISPQLQKALVPKFPTESCRTNYAHLGTISSNMFCYGGDGDLDSCLGDSGGPLVVPRDSQHFLIGVVSYGVPCAVKHYPTVYTKVMQYLDWIYGKINI